MHNRKLARTIADAGWGGFLSKLKYKAERSGKFFIQTDTFFPSSKTCPRCRYKFDGLTLAMRQWICPKCGGLNLRDYAAAINIKREGIVQLKAAGLAVLRRQAETHGGSVRPFNRKARAVEVRSLARLGRGEVTLRALDKNQTKSGAARDSADYSNPNYDLIAFNFLFKN